VFEHANEVNAVIVVLAVASMMVLSGMAKHQLIWRQKHDARTACQFAYAGGGDDDPHSSARRGRTMSLFHAARGVGVAGAPPGTATQGVRAGEGTPEARQEGDV
jgi:hypothetical protein